VSELEGVSVLLSGNAPINVKPQGGKGGHPWEIDMQGCPLGRDFKHTWCPIYLTFRGKVSVMVKFDIH